MTEKGYKVLENVINNFGSDFIDKVITSEDKKIENDYYKEIIEICRKNKIECLKRKDAKEITSKFIFTIAWKWIIPLNKDQKIIVLHDSLLPHLRGFNPLVTSLINGEQKIGVTALFANEKYDEGDIICQSSTLIKYPVKIQNVINLLNRNYCEVIDKICRLIIANKKIPAKPQSNKNVSYSLWREENDYRINWNLDSNFIKRFIDSVGFPYLGASASAGDKQIRIVDSDIYPDLKIINRDPGKIIFFDDNCPVVVCGKGLLKINEMKYEGKDFKISKLRTRLS
jgi:methionyl-tRNA formyltransferase